jgi:hypothetical protein
VLLKVMVLLLVKDMVLLLVKAMVLLAVKLEVLLRLKAMVLLLVKAMALLLVKAMALLLVELLQRNQRTAPQLDSVDLTHTCSCTVLRNANNRQLFQASMLSMLAALYDT